MSYWENPKPVQRTRAVAVDDLARETVALLDGGGIPALTIRSLAGRLGVAPPSLYSRITTVDDLLDLALDRALDHDAQVWIASDAGPDALLLALYDHLRSHPWASHVIGLRAPRGPAYYRFSEQLLDLLVENGVRDPLTVAYAMSNYVIGSAATTASAGDEPVSPIDPARAPTYARLHEEHNVEPRLVVAAGLRALRKTTVSDGT